MRTRNCTLGNFGIAVVLAAGVVLCAEGRRASRGDDGGPASETSETVSPKEALEEFNDLIGGWSGVGQPRRGSNNGAWREDAEWVWEFDDDAVSIRCDVTEGKLLTTAELTWDVEAGQFKLLAEVPDVGERTYAGALDDERLVLLSEPDDYGYEHRITVTRLNRKRTLVLFEKRQEGRRSFSRVAEVGYTREGTRLATTEGSGPECVVTGGTGTIPVMYNGKTYYVCCTGCRQAFEDDPEGIIAEYEARLAERRAEAEAEQ